MNARKIQIDRTGIFVDTNGGSIEYMINSFNKTGSKVYQTLSLAQGIYVALTALWALVDIDSFMKVTGPKTDIWLVKTVAVLLVPIALCFLAGGALPAESQLVVLMGLTTSAGLAFIDFYYTGKGVIKWVYLIDGIIESLFFILWVIVAILALKQQRQKSLHRYTSSKPGYARS
jgi:hypothetical protein